MIISSAFGWFAGIRGINSFFWRLCAGLLAVIVLSSFLGFGVHTYLNRDEARYGKVDVFVGGRKAVQAALIHLSAQRTGCISGMAEKSRKRAANRLYRR